MARLLLLLLLLAAPAWADSVETFWAPAADATSYDVERTTGSVVTGPWTVIATVTSANACKGTPAECIYVDASAPSAGGVFYRLTAKNQYGATTIRIAGGWYCGNCPGPPRIAGAVGVSRASKPPTRARARK